MLCESGTKFPAEICSMEATSIECLSEVQSILSCPFKVAAARSLQGNEAQMFVDFLDRVLERSSLDDKFRQRSLLLLAKICKARSIVPAGYVLQGEIHVGQVHHHSVFADVSKGEYSGFPVAIKRLRANEGSSTRVFKRFCREIIGWRHLIHPNILPLLGVSVVTDSNCFDILTKWMPYGNLMQYTRSNPEVNRLQLLSGVMSGVVYLHRLSIVHGDLKGANVLVDLVDNAPIARVTDFGLMNMADLGTNILSESFVASAGTFRWMSPELLDPKRFKSNGRLTRGSDCYALGMVIYEVLTGLPPFYNMCAFSPVTAVVLDGRRPEKPLHAESLGFSDTIWELLQLCWSGSSSVRPTALQLFEKLSAASLTWVPASVYPIAISTDNAAGAGFSDSSGESLMNLIREAYISTTPKSWTWDSMEGSVIPSVVLVLFSTLLFKLLL